MHIPESDTNAFRVVMSKVSITVVGCGTAMDNAWKLPAMFAQRAPPVKASIEPHTHSTGFRTPLSVRKQ